MVGLQRHAAKRTFAARSFAFCGLPLPAFADRVGERVPPRAHHRGRDRALETRVRLSSGPDGLIPAIKIATAPSRPLRRVGGLSAVADSATTSAPRTWCPARSVPLRSSTTTTATPTRCSTCPPPPGGSTSWPGAVLIAPSQTVFVTAVLHGLLLALALQKRRPRWLPRDPRPPCCAPPSAGRRVQITPSTSCQRKQPALWASGAPRPPSARGPRNGAAVLSDLGGGDGHDGHVGHVFPTLH